jgi:hypothetical protein
MIAPAVEVARRLTPELAGRAALGLDPEQAEVPRW